MKQALELLEAHRPAEALEAIRHQLHTDPANPLLLALLGVVLTRTGELDEAVEALDRAHYLEPDNPQILVDYGNALLAVGRIQSARSRFEAALRLDSSHQGALRSLAELYQRLATHSTSDLPSAAAPAVTPTPVPSVNAGSQSTPFVRRSAEDPVGARVGSGISNVPTGVDRPTRAPISFASAPPEQQDLSRWDPEPLPSLGSLARATLLLWGQQPLIWLLLVAIPNAVAAALIPTAAELRWVTVLLWTAALGIGTGPALLAMSNQWIFGRLQGGSGRFSGVSLAHGTILSLLYALLVLGPFGIALALRSPLPPSVIILAVLLTTSPFHALLGPALVLSATDGPPGWPALQRAWLLAGKRSWLHLALLVGVAVVVGGVLAPVAWAFAVTLRAQGDAVSRVLEVAGLSLGETLWVALVTVTGSDAISAAEVDIEPTARR